MGGSITRRARVPVRTLAGTLLTGVLIVAAPRATAGQNVVRYQPGAHDYKYLYATLPPVAVLKPGEILETRTADCFGDAIQKPGDSLALAKGDNPLTGPFAITGAEPGDTLVVKILDLKVDSAKGLGALAPGFGALNATNYTPMLNGSVPEKIWFYDIDNATNTATYHALDSSFSVKIQMQPFLGCIGVAPAGGEARASVVPAEVPAATWTCRKSGQGTRCTCPSTRRTLCCTSVTATPRRAMAKWPGRRSKCPCACVCRSI